MASITIRDIPEELFSRLKQMAVENRRSINAEILAVLDRAVQKHHRRALQIHALEEIACIRKSQPLSHEEDTLAILREGRQ